MYRGSFELNLHQLKRENGNVGVERVKEGERQLHILQFRGFKRSVEDTLQYSECWFGDLV